MKKTDHAIIALGILGNILSVVGVVLSNKFIINQGFNYTMVLSACHFAITWLGCHLILQLNGFTYKAAAIQNLLPVAVGSLGSVAFMNLNLAHNSVGFYQLSKLMCIPFTIGVQRMFFNQHASMEVKLTLIPILFGVGLATVHDIAVNAMGTVFAIVAVIFTTFSQIFTQRYQAALECTALQLLYLTSPLICIGMLALAPFFDDLQSLKQAVKQQRLSPALIVWIFVSCLLALGVNISNYFVLGKTSPLTYQVLGHLKTVLIIVLGVLLFNSSVDMRQFAGITIAIFGVVGYTEVKRRQALKPTSRLPK